MTNKAKRRTYVSSQGGRANRGEHEIVVDRRLHDSSDSRPSCLKRPTNKDQLTPESNLGGVLSRGPNSRWIGFLPGMVVGCCDAWLAASAMLLHTD